jgi:hypothetical protein
MRLKHCVLQLRMETVQDATKFSNLPALATGEFPPQESSATEMRICRGNRFSLPARRRQVYPPVQMFPE